MSDRKWDQLESMRKIRKPMPKPGRTIMPHDDEDKFDWRKEMDQDEEDYRGIKEMRDTSS